MPDLGLHPDEGAARARPRAEDRPARKGLGHLDSRRRGSPRHAAGAGAQGSGRQRLDQGRRVPVQEKQDRLDQGHGAVDGKRRRRGLRRRRAAAARTQGDHRRHRIGAAQRPRHSDRPQTHHHQRRSDRPARGAEVDRHPRQRRRRASSSRPSSGGSAARSPYSSCSRGWCRSKTRRCRRNWQSRFASRASPRTPGHASRARTWPGIVVEVGAQLEDGSTQTIRAEYLLVATGRGPGDRWPRRRARRARPREGLHQGRSSVSDQRPRDLGDRRRHHAGQRAAPAARTRLVGRGHRCGRAHRGT